MSAFLMGEANRDKPLRTFDWDKAARILAERKPERALAGLEGDFEYTGGYIWWDGEPHEDDYTYLSSTWAPPVLVIDDDVIECWVYEDEGPGWDRDTKWPKSALAIVRGEQA